MKKTATHNVPLLDLTEEEKKEVLTKHKLTALDYSNILAILQRTPTLAELGVFSAMWSEHCSYKSSKIHLRKLPSAGPQVVIGPGENAGVVRLKNKLCLAFKMESHNHPSFIDPYQGAATGVGGILRDVFCMGARPVALLNALRFGEKTHKKTPWLCEHVVQGIGDYGNCVGIPTVAGSTSFDESYNGNILVNAMAVGTVHEDKIFTGKASGVGNLIYYVGAATGRDGIHGATMASDSFDSSGEEERSAVQVGDPFFEKLLLEATLEVLEKNLVLGLQDMGAAGLTSSIFEMASRGETGVRIDLEKVPTRTSDMTPYELMLSESQERMLMVIDPKNKEALEQIFSKWDLAFNQIGVITNTKKVEAYFYGDCHINIPIAPLVEKAPVYDRPIKKPIIQDDSPDLETQWLEKCKGLDVEELIEELFLDKIFHQDIYRQYDHEVGLKTVLGPNSGGAAVLEIPGYEEEETTSIAVTANCLEKLCQVDPRLGAKHSVYKTARTLIATGAKPLAITDCLNYGNPEDPEVMWQFSEGTEGIKEACLELKTPVVSGNVSLYNETNGKSIAPTPMIGMVGSLENKKFAKPAFSNKEGVVYLLTYKEDYLSLVGSPLAKILKLKDQYKKLPDIKPRAEEESAKLILKICHNPSILAIKDVDRQGLLISLLKMTGSDKDLTTYCQDYDDLKLYLSSLVGGYLIQVQPSFEEAFLEFKTGLTHNNLIKVGEIVNGENKLHFSGKKINLAQMKLNQRDMTKNLF